MNEPEVYADEDVDFDDVDPYPILAQAYGDFDRATRIEVTEDHLTLLAHCFTSWDPAEFGAPELDPKRPYGNSDVVDDLHDLLPHLPIEVAIRRHAELSKVLEALLHARKFEAGRYERSKYNNDWKYVGPLTDVDGEVVERLELESR